MSTDHTQLIESLQAQVKPIEPQDTMAEAGRKALLGDFVKMLQHEAGSRTGEDPEEVHDMRVATRRMRSTLRLLGAYFKPRAIEPYLSELRRLASLLGEVRDLDVMIGNLQSYQENLDADQRDLLQPVLSLFEGQRQKARRDLIRRLDKGSYRRFLDDYAEFVTKPGKGAIPVDLEDVHPYQVRHLLPELIFQHLAAIRAYDSTIEHADVPTLHALRIEFKRLRYAVSIFSDVFGTSIASFADELKTIQDHLGNIADVRAAKDRLSDIADDLDPQDQAETLAALQHYVDSITEKQDQLRDSFADLWRHFNTKTVQRQLSAAVAGL